VLQVCFSQLPSIVFPLPAGCSRDFIYTVLRLGLIAWLVYPGCNGAETLFNVLMGPFLAQGQNPGARAPDAGGSEMKSLLASGTEGGSGGLEAGGQSGSQSAQVAEQVKRLSPEVQEALTQIVTHLDNQETVNILFQVRVSFFALQYSTVQ